MMDRIPMTRTGYDKLKAELDELQHVQMRKLEERVALARSEGDLSENAEYHGARESLGMLHARVNLLRDKLARADIVNPSQMPRDRVSFGGTVVVKDLDTDDLEEYTLVGAGEEDYALGKILVTSPFAQGLMGKQMGERIELQVPMGTLRYEIVEIRFPEG